MLTSLEIEFISESISLHQGATKYGAMSDAVLAQVFICVRHISSHDLNIMKFDQYRDVTKLHSDQIIWLDNFNQRLKLIGQFLAKETAAIDRQLTLRVTDVNDQ